MSVKFDYTGDFNIGLLSDDLVASGVALLTIRGSKDEIVVVCENGQVRAPVDAIVAAHDPSPPESPEIQRLRIALAKPQTSPVEKDIIRVLLGKIGV